MPIEITGKSPVNSTPAAAAEASAVRQPNAAQRETGKSSTVDTVSFTDTAARLRGLEKTLSALPVVDIHRVEGVKQAIASGAFEINPMRVADRLLNFESSLHLRRAA
ncbi:MAG: flagellar biosynthesis anti-sigma factor FlgM [Gammaproteobacteria bacterium]